MWVAIAVVILLILLVPWWLEWRRDPMNKRARAKAPGDFVKLSRGETHYRWDGPKNGPVVVAIHGLTTPNFIWNAMVPRLAAKGIRVLRYDLYGRGYSDRPKGTQDRDFFNNQLRELLDALDLKEPVGLMGYSLGGAVATAFAAENPNRVRNLILIAPAGLTFEATAFEAFVARVPLIGDWAMGALFARRMRKGLQAEEDGEVPGITKAKARELKYRGYLRSVLASLRGILLEQMVEDHKAIAEKKIPVLAIWAQQDVVIPLKGLGYLAQINRASRNEMVEGAAHIMPHTHAAEIMQRLGDLSRP